MPVVGPFGASDTSTVGGGNYQVTGASNSTKPDQLYVQDTWVDSQGRANFRFSPILPCSTEARPTQKIYLLETLTADIALSDLAGQQAELSYDDTPPFTDLGLNPMPYCTIDPRQGQPAGQLATSRRPAGHRHVVHRLGHPDRRGGRNVHASTSSTRRTTGAGRSARTSR